MADNLTAGNPRAHRVRVFFDEVSTLIYEGMPVCYEYDATTNWFGGSVGDDGVVSATTTTAEGGQNEGKYIYVKIPVTANLHAFAGVVAKGGWCGKTTSALKGIPIDIYVPNGAIVPVRTDASTTVGVTVLGIANTDTECISGGYPVGIAWETEDCSTDNAVVLAKLDPNMFVRQAITVNALTGGVVNSLQNTFVATSGTVCGIMVHTTSSGVNATSQNNWSVLAYLAVSGGATGTGYSRASLSQLQLSGTYNNGGLYMYGAHVQVAGTPTLTLVQRVAGLCVEYGTTVPTTGDADVVFLYANPSGGDLNSYVHMWGDGEKADVIWKFSGCGGLSTSTLIKKMGTGGMWTNTGEWGQIPIDLNGTTFYIPYGALLSEA